MRYSSIRMFQMTLGNILTALMGAAVFERFPKFRVVFGESGIGWLPYLHRPHGQRVSRTNTATSR